MIQSQKMEGTSQTKAIHSFVLYEKLQTVYINNLLILNVIIVYDFF